MFCKKCGIEAEEDAMFCHNCGMNFSSIQSNSVPPISVKKNNSWTIGKIVKLVLTIIVVGGAIFLRFGMGIFNSINNEAVDTNNNGLSAFNSGNSEQAISQFKKASDDALSNDTKRASLINLAYTYSTENSNDLALKTFREALALADNNSFDYYLVSGEIRLLEKKPDKALLNYDKAYQINPSDFQINNALNLFYLNLDENSKSYTNYPKALGYAQKAYEVSADTIKNIAKENLAVAYFFNEKYDQALPLFLSMDLTNKPYFNYWIGLTYIVKGDNANAKFYLQKAKNAGVKLEPELSKYLY
jgi:tetratricopeptide (TPR) repeat protein